MLCSWVNFYVFLSVSLISRQFFTVKRVSIFLQRNRSKCPPRHVLVNKGSSPKSIIRPTVWQITITFGMKTQHMCKFWSLFHTILWVEIVQFWNRYLRLALGFPLITFLPLSIADPYFQGLKNNGGDQTTFMSQFYPDF